MTERDLIAYTAGYIDGDGCLYMGKHFPKFSNYPNYEASLQILSVRKAPLVLFKNKWGGSIRSKKTKPSHKTPFVWGIKGKKAFQLLQRCLPYLVDKEERAHVFIEMRAHIQANNFQQVSQEGRAVRDDLISKNRAFTNQSQEITKEMIQESENRKMTIPVQEIDYPYLAGLIDSEGCFRVKKWKPKARPRSVYSIHLEIGNSKFPIIEWLIARFGGSISYAKGAGRKKPAAIWSLSSKSLNAILPKIYPHLISKKEVCKKLMDFQETIIPNGGDRHSQEFNELFEKTVRTREKIVEEIHKLNAKGS